MQFPNHWYLAFPLLLIAGCTQSNEYQAPPAPTVKVASPIVKTVTNFLEETATTEAVAKVEIRARVQGFVDSVKFEPGSEVAKGDLLYEIEPQLYIARVDSALAAQLAAKAARTNAEAEKKRQEKIREQNPRATSEAAIMKAQAEYETADAAINLAKANLDQAKINLDYATVEAPIDGRVGKSLVKQGNLVGGDIEPTLLTTVIKYDPIYANFNISERKLLELLDSKPKNDAGKPDNEKIAIFLSRENDKGFPFEGHFEYADLAVDQSTGTFMIRGIFPNPDRRIIPGLFVTVRMPIDVRENAVLIPERAVAADQAGRYVFVVNSENEVERRTVTRGMKDGELVVITEGLTADDTVIIDGLQRARPGATVNPERIELVADTVVDETIEQSRTNPSAPPAESFDNPTAESNAGDKIPEQQP